jgi:predicted nucleic acid-binding protein
LTVVLDSWAVMRYLEDAGTAAARVAKLLDEQRPLMSWINLGEVFYVLRRRRGEREAADTVRDLRLAVDVRLPDERIVIDAARIRADHSMSYADAFAAALAITNDAVLWTGDPELLIPRAPWKWKDLRPAAR